MFYELSRQRQMYGAKPLEIQGVIELVQCERLMLSLEVEILSAAMKERDAMEEQNV
jgi:hypothetical protein